MAEQCIFCGKAVTFFSKTDLPCGGADQPVCSECAEKYSRESPLQRARLALDTGRAKEPGKLTAFLEREEKRQQEREKWQEKASRCPACGTEMELKLENFSIGRDGGGGLMALLMDEYSVNLYACPRCGKVELYTADFWKEEEEAEDLVTCPVCGKEHSPQIGCPRCALRSGQERQTTYGPKKERDKKPPWEK